MPPTNKKDSQQSSKQGSAVKRDLKAQSKQIAAPQANPRITRSQQQSIKKDIVHPPPPVPITPTSSAKSNKRQRHQQADVDGLTPQSQSKRQKTNPQPQSNQTPEEEKQGAEEEGDSTNKHIDDGAYDQEQEQPDEEDEESIANPTESSVNWQSEYDEWFGGEMPLAVAERTTCLQCFGQRQPILFDDEHRTLDKLLRGEKIHDESHCEEVVTNYQVLGYKNGLIEARKDRDFFAQLDVGKLYTSRYQGLMVELMVHLDHGLASAKRKAGRDIAQKFAQDCANEALDTPRAMSEDEHKEACAWITKNREPIWAMHLDHNIVAKGFKVNRDIKHVGGQEALALNFCLNLQTTGYTTPRNFLQRTAGRAGEHHMINTACQTHTHAGNISDLGPLAIAQPISSWDRASYVNDYVVMAIRTKVFYPRLMDFVKSMGTNLNELIVRSPNPIIAVVTRPNKPDEVFGYRRAGTNSKTRKPKWCLHRPMTGQSGYDDDDKDIAAMPNWFAGASQIIQYELMTISANALTLQQYSQLDTLPHIRIDSVSLGPKLQLSPFDQGPVAMSFRDTIQRIFKPCIKRQ